MRHRRDRFLLGNRVIILCLVLLAGGVRAQPDPVSTADAVSSARDHHQTPNDRSADRPEKTRSVRKNKSRRSTGTGRKSGKQHRRRPEPLPEPGTLAYAWHALIWAYTYPFYYLNDVYGPFAANIFGGAAILIVLVLPGLLGPKKERGLKLKERLVRAKNTRLRVKASQNVEQYVAAVDTLTKDVDELSFPMRGLRKMYKLPPASPVTYSKAIKELKKEEIHVNQNVYVAAPRSLDKALQDLRGCLARELEVSTEEAGEMASTVMHRSNQPRTIGDPFMALQAMVADTPLVELRLLDERRQPLSISCHSGKVEVRRGSTYVVTPTGANQPLLYLKLSFSINFRSTTDEGTLRVMRHTPGVDKEFKSHKLDLPEPVPWRIVAAAQNARHQADLWIERKLSTVSAVVSWPWRALGLSSPPAHGVDAERVRVLSVGMENSADLVEFQGLLAEFLKSTTALQIGQLTAALGLDIDLEMSMEEAESWMKDVDVAVDGVQVADVGPGIVQRVKNKMTQRISDTQDVTPEQVQDLIDRALVAAGRQCTGEEAYRVMVGLFRHRGHDIDVVRDREFLLPLEITTEGGEVVVEFRMLFSIVNYATDQPSVLQWIQVRHKTRLNEPGSLGQLQFQDTPAPVPAKPTKAPKPAKSQKRSREPKDNNSKVLAKVRTRLKELERIKQGKIQQNDSVSSSPTSSKYPSTVGSRPSSTGSSPHVMEEPVLNDPKDLPSTNTKLLNSPAISQTTSDPPSMKPRAAALARAFLKRAGKTPPVSPALASPPEGEVSVEAAIPEHEEIGVAEHEEVGAAEHEEAEEHEEAGAEDHEEAGAEEHEEVTVEAAIPEHEEVPVTPPAPSMRRKSLDPLDDKFEEYFEKLVASSPQVLESDSEDTISPANSTAGLSQIDTNHTSAPGTPVVTAPSTPVVDQARAYLAAQAKASEGGSDTRPDWLQAVEEASRSAEQARMAANAALDRIKIGGASPLLTPVTPVTPP